MPNFCYLKIIHYWFNHVTIQNILDILKNIPKTMRVL